MIIIGIILIVLGGASWVYGSSVNNDMDIQLESFFNNGNTGTGDNFVIIGIILLVIGFILVIAGIAKYLMSQNKNNTDSRAKTLDDLRAKGLISQEDYNARVTTRSQVDTTEKNYVKSNFKYCKHCGMKLDGDSLFCPKCGTKQ